MHFVGWVCIWCRVGGVGARSRKRGGLGYRLVRKHARTEMLDLLISVFLGFFCFAPKIHRSTFLSNTLSRRSLVLDTVHVSEAYVSTGLISTLYINILVFFVVRWDLRLAWAGHLVRMNSDRTLKKIFNTKPDGARSVGRPKLRWEDGVDQDMRILGVKNWKKVALNRDE